MIMVAANLGDLTITLEQFRAAAASWGPHARLELETEADDPSDATIVVERPGEPMFQIAHYRSQHLLSTDGTPEQAAEVASWAAASFPLADGELWIADEGYDGHAVARPGITADDIRDSWQEH